MNVDYAKRRRKVQRELERRKLACLVVTHPANWFYLTGFTGESGALVVSGEGATLLTDGRFTVQARQETQGLHIELQKGALFTALGELLKRKGWKRAGYDPGQLTVAQLEAVKKAAGSKWKGTDASGVVSDLRMQKDAQELAAMRKAAILAGEALESVLPMLKPGV
jgi:Xaa-Pro aminopeptidase